ncbi:hypothetical protein ACP70R_042097 [Stipagrostis hirtigluma subsp. patula]
MAANVAGQAAAPTNARPAPKPMLDPELFMAARRGDSNRLKELLRLNDAVQAGTVEPTAMAAQQVVVEVGRWAGAGAAGMDPPVGVMAMAAAQQVTAEVNAQPAPTVVAAAQEEVVVDGPTAPSSLLQLLDGVTINEGDYLLHVVAACGDGNEFLRCARMIYRGNTRLLDARNNKGDTPLHCAAAAGNANMVSCLVALVTNGETAAKEFVGTRNGCGETALLHAVRAASKACIDKLMSVDPELACIPHEGDDGDTTSPLYLAISLGKEDIAEHLIHKSNRKLSCSGPDGRNVLHAAVTRAQAMPMLLDRFKDQPVDTHELTVQRDNQTGSTPLHLAASLAGWPDAKILSKGFPYVWPRPKSAVTLLLNANPCAAYLPDTQGLYPIHVAAMNGSLDAVRTLLERLPDCATLRDGKGRTFLHVAVEEKRYKVVQYASSGLMPEEFSLIILNAQDNNGDTALHRAVHVGNLQVVNCLIRNQHVHLNIPNKNALTPLDLSWFRIPRLFYYNSNPRSLIHSSLQIVGAPCGGSRPDLLSEKHIPKRDIDKVSKHLTNASQVLGIVSVLVATVTFASAFTLPGGYYQSGSINNTGAALLAGSYTFDAFIISDTLAFICSCIATFSLIFVGVPAMDISIRLRYFEISAQLMRSSGRSLVVAFALGLYLVLAPVAHTTAIAVCVIISISSLYGNLEAWQCLAVANTARARLGTRMPLAWTSVAMFYNVFISLLLQFWPFLIIFGLPAIWN